jgi:hypothetical protein
MVDPMGPGRRPKTGFGQCDWIEDHAGFVACYRLDRTVNRYVNTFILKVMNEERDILRLSQP